MTIHDFQIAIENLRVNVLFQRMNEPEPGAPQLDEDDDASPLAGLVPLAQHHLSLALASLEAAERHAAIAAYYQEQTGLGPCEGPSGRGK